MPIIHLRLFEGRLTEETSPLLIEKLTNALVDVYGEGIRDHTQVVLEETSPKHWGTSGKPMG